MMRRTGSFLALMATCVLILYLANVIETDNVFSRERSVKVITGPGSFSRKPRKACEDPVPPLGEGDRCALRGGLTRLELTKLHDGYVDRMLARYPQETGFPSGLAEYLKVNRDVGEVFVTAIDPRYDDIGAAAKVFEELRLADERLLKKYVHLATALAVVYDTPDAVSTSRYHSLWAVTQKQFYALPKYREIWDYYTDPVFRSRFGFALDKLPWPLLVHLVDNDVNHADRKWALANYDGRSAETGELYASVKYDNDKSAGKKSKLGTRAYTLPKLLKYGGVCIDQAHFASRVAKCLGIPAMKVIGGGRFGGKGHAWTGFLALKNGRPSLEFTERYFFEYYHTGDVFDPQTRTMTLDRYVAMEYAGVSLSYSKYNHSRLLVRMAEGIKLERPAEALELAQEALKLNPFNTWGWPLLMEFVKDGTLPKNEALAWADRMMTVLKDHPDMTYYCLETFIDCIPATDEASRQSLYDQAAKLYAKRPDLLKKLRRE